ncbi:MAG: low affinity iron permease family protein [Verrucomicrobiota bacterium]
MSCPVKPLVKPKAMAEPPSTLKESFRRFAYRTACWTGTPAAFLLSCLLLLAWIVSGPIFHFSDTWQLVINTSTTIVTFLMVFLVQSTQNRDAKAIHLKLDELIRAVGGARNRLVCLEELSDEELDRLEKEFVRLRDRSRKNGHSRSGSPRH